MTEKVCVCGHSWNRHGDESGKCYGAIFHDPFDGSFVDDTTGCPCNDFQEHTLYHIIAELKLIEASLRS